MAAAQAAEQLILDPLRAELSSLISVKPRFGGISLRRMILRLGK